MSSIVVIGATTLDATFRLPADPAALTDVEAALIPGGKGLNQAVAAKRLGGREVTLISACGEDRASLHVAHYLAELVGLRTLWTVHRELSLPIVSIIATRDEVQMVAFPTGEMPLVGASDPEMLLGLRELLRNARVVLLTLDFASAVLASVATEVAAARAEGAELALILNPAPAQRLSSSATDSLRHVTWLVPNEEEACALAGRNTPAHDWEALGAVLRDMGAENVCITHGNRGCTIVTPAGVTRHAGYRVCAVDPTGASDAFCAALAIACERRLPPLAAIATACAAGALAVSSFGASSSMPTLAEVDALLARRDPTYSGVLL